MSYPRSVVLGQYLDVLMHMASMAGGPVCYLHSERMVLASEVRVVTINKDCVRIKHLPTCDW